MGTIAVGAIWSGKVRHRQWVSKRRRRQSGDLPTDPEEEDEDKMEDLDISPTAILVFVVLMCGTLVLLYFLYDYLGALITSALV
jgi:signal peptide peptidase-like protein 2B